MNDTPTHVYIMECGGLIKIGVSNNPERRLQDMRSGMPIKPSIVTSKVFPSARAAFNVERKMHRYFHRRRGHGEWFDVPADEAQAVLRRMRPAPQKHLQSDEWMKPTDKEARDAVDKAFARGRAAALADMSDSEV